MFITCIAAVIVNIIKLTFILFITLFKPTVYCLITLVPMLDLNLACGWSNLTPIGTLLKHKKKLREFNYNLLPLSPLP